ncbi:MAG: ABC transporter ATP-binding protein [Desulfobacterales bacterium]|jgi:ATP-binding cassette subfamily B protein
MKSTSLIKPYFIENRWLIGIGLVSLIIVDVLQLFIPRVIKWAVDDLTTLQVNGTGLLIYAMYLAVIGLLIGLFRYIWRHCLLGTSRRVEEGLRNLLFSHIQTLSAAYFDQTKTGDLMAHATNDIQQVRMATGMGLVALNDAVVLGAAAIVFMAYINITLTLFVLIPMPVIVVGTKFFSKKMHRRYRDVQEAFSDLTEAVRERFAGIRLIKAYSWENEEAGSVEKISKRYIDKNIRLVKITGTFFPMMLLLTNLSLAIVIYLGGRQAIKLVITPGDFVAFISYLGLLTWPMMALGWVTNLIQRGKASLDRLNKILQTQPEIIESPAARFIDRSKGEIAFEEVAFAYRQSERATSLPVLSDINFHLAPGRILGIVGPPGSGKTTLLNLIPRLYDASQGRILLDGKDIRHLKISRLRAQISFLSQEPFIFAGTIRQNITLGNQNIGELELVKATADASVYDTIQTLPEKFDTIVGEKGVVLSGGQKQRVALARTMLISTPVLILDDPISQVDLETGAIIIDAIRSMAGSRTIIVVSHRLSAVRFADEIITLKNGKILESGTHDRLLASDNYYAKTFRLQEFEEDLDAI